MITKQFTAKSKDINIPEPLGVDVAVFSTDVHMLKLKNSQNLHLTNIFIYTIPESLDIEVSIAIDKRIT